MEYAVVCTVAVLVSGLTLVSGFGLGTVLMPAFALFFPVPVAIAATAVVHLATNVFKVLLVGRMADWGVVARFALPGAAAAVLGASLLGVVAGVAPVASYELAGHELEVTAVGLVVGVLIVAFAVLELVPAVSRLQIERRYLPVGGIVSGFFGGLSGNQGALRATFLIKAGLDTQAYVGTSTVSAVVVDVARLAVYGIAFLSADVAEVAQIWPLVAAACLAAFLGAVLGARVVQKVTLRTLHLVVAVMLIGVGTGLALGLL